MLVVLGPARDYLLHLALLIQLRLVPAERKTQMVPILCFLQLLLPVVVGAQIKRRVVVEVVVLEVVDLQMQEQETRHQLLLHKAIMAVFQYRALAVQVAVHQQLVRVDNQGVLGPLVVMAHLHLSLVPR